MSHSTPRFPVRAALIAVLLSAVACGTTRIVHSTLPIDASEWVHVSSPHFNVHTDLPAQQARERAQMLEEINAALLELAFKSSAPPKDKVEVVLFAEKSAFKTVAPVKWFGGFTRTDIDFDDSVWIVLPATGDRQEREILQHELTHRFVHYFMPGAPTWLNEGMAEFYETMDVDKRSAVIGEASFPFAPMGSPRSNSYIVMDELPDASTVSSMRPRVFYASNHHKANVNYAAAWLLVSMLVTQSSEDAAHFWAYVSALSQGATAQEAWDAHLAPLPLDDKYERYRRRARIGVATVPYRRPIIDAAAFTTRPMQEHEVSTLLATLAKKPKDAKALIARALHAAPDSAEVHHRAGSVHVRIGDMESAEREFLKALSLAPDDQRSAVALAEVRYAVEAKKPEAKCDLRSLVPEMEKLASISNNKSAQNTAAWYFADLGEVDRGLALARRSVELAPACWECLDTLFAKVTS